MKKIVRSLLFISIAAAFWLFGKIETTQVEQFTENSQTVSSSEVINDELNVASVSEQAKTKNYFVKITSEEAQLYQTANTSSKKLLEINKGELVELEAIEKNFYKIQTTNGLIGYIRLQDGQKLEYTKQKTPTNLSEATIVLDAGHGGEDTGALSNDETLYEKDVTLETASIVQSALESEGATVILTRTADTTISLDEICKISIEAKADVFISIHFDSTDYMNEASGTTTYFYSIINSMKSWPKPSINRLHNGFLCKIEGLNTETIRF